MGIRLYGALEVLDVPYTLIATASAAATNKLVARGRTIAGTQLSLGRYIQCLDADLLTVNSTSRH